MTVTVVINSWFISSLQSYTIQFGLYEPRWGKRNCLRPHKNIYNIVNVYKSNKTYFICNIFYFKKVQKRATKCKTSRVDMYSLEDCTGLSLILSPEANSSTARGWKVSKASLVQMFTPSYRAHGIRCARSQLPEQFLAIWIYFTWTKPTLYNPKPICGKWGSQIYLKKC